MSARFEHSFGKKKNTLKSNKKKANFRMKEEFWIQTYINLRITLCSSLNKNKIKAFQITGLLST